MPKKIKMLVLDDNPKSMEAVVRSCLPCHTDANLYEDMIYDAVGELIDVIHCASVTAAIDAYKKNKPDIVFTDLLLKNNDEQDPEVLRWPYQGLCFIKWLRENATSNLIIKVHSQYLYDKNVEDMLHRYGLGLPDAFWLPKEDDFVSLEKLQSRLPDLLRAIAQKYWRKYASNADTRQDLRHTLKKYSQQGALDLEIKGLENFSVRTLMAGWMLLKEENGEPVLDWQTNAQKALEELGEVNGNTSILLDTNPSSKGRSVQSILDELWKTQESPLLCEQAEKQARPIIESFLKIWSPSPHGPHIPRLECGGLEDATQDIEAIKRREPNDHVYIKTLRLRLIVGGLHALRHRFNDPIRNRIVDYAILACIRNSPAEALRYQDHGPQVRKYLSVLGLGQITGPGGYQELRAECFYERENQWFENLKNNL